jgi:hypothetical protein
MKKRITGTTGNEHRERGIPGAGSTGGNREIPIGFPVPLLPCGRISLMTTENRRPKYVIPPSLEKPSLEN